MDHFMGSRHRLEEPSTPTRSMTTPVSVRIASSWARPFAVTSNEAQVRSSPVVDRTATVPLCL